MSREDPVSQDEIAEEALFGDVSGLVEQAQRRTSVAVNTQLVGLYWQIGKRVREDVLGGERAAYGQDVVKRLASRLSERYGRGYSWRNLFRMVKFGELYPSPEILPTLSAKLGWSHITEILQLADASERDFYATTAANESWSVRVLRERIASQLYARTVVPNRSDSSAWIPVRSVRLSTSRTMCAKDCRTGWTR